MGCVNDAGQSSALLLQPLFDLLSLADIGDKAVPDQIAVFQWFRAGVSGYPDLAQTRVTYTVLGAPVRALDTGAPDILLDHGQIVRMDQIDCRLRVQRCLLGRHVVDIGNTLAGVRKPAVTALIHLVLVNHARQVLGQLVEALQQRFALLLGGGLFQQTCAPATAQADKIGIGFIKALAT